MPGAAQARPKPRHCIAFFGWCKEFCATDGQSGDGGCRASSNPCPETASSSVATGPCARSGAAGPGSVWLAATKVRARRRPQDHRARRDERRRAPSARPRPRPAAPSPLPARVRVASRTTSISTSRTSTCRASTLRQALRARTSSTTRAPSRRRPRCSTALAFAHAQGIVHRDVKPSNVLVADGDEISVRLFDFGLAQLADAETLTAVGDVPGTLAYIPPERLHGEQAGPPADVWAVGVLLWEALAGQHPFWRASPLETGEADPVRRASISEARPDLPRAARRRRRPRARRRSGRGVRRPRALARGAARRVAGAGAEGAAPDSRQCGSIRGEPRAGRRAGARRVSWPGGRPPRCRSTPRAGRSLLAALAAGADDGRSRASGSRSRWPCRCFRSGNVVARARDRLRAVAAAWLAADVGRRAARAPLRAGARARAARGARARCRSSSCGASGRVPAGCARVCRRARWRASSPASAAAEIPFTGRTRAARSASPGASTRSPCCRPLWHGSWPSLALGLEALVLGVAAAALPLVLAPGRSGDRGVRSRLLAGTLLAAPAAGARSARRSPPGSRISRSTVHVAPAAGARRAATHFRHGSGDRHVRFSAIG